MRTGAEDMEADRIGTVIRVHLLRGDPHGSRVLSATHSNTKGVAVPRSEYEAVSRELEDFQRAGAYILVYPLPETGGFSERVYVGQVDVAKDRIDTHHKDPAKDWTSVALFTSRDKTMNNVYAQFLESRLVSLARTAGRAELVNRNDPQEPTLDAEDRDTASHFLRDIIVYCPILGINAFEVPLVSPPRLPPAAATDGAVGPSDTQSTQAPDSVGVTYHLQHLPAARGTNTPAGFVVFTGSPLRPSVAPSADERVGVTVKRATLAKRGVLQTAGDGEVTFARDYTFDSPSAAAVFLLGYPVSGRTEWVDNSGRALNEVESDQA